MSAAQTGTDLPRPPLSHWSTTAEIQQQPRVWRDLAETIDATAATIGSWIRARHHDEIWFCGAGTSAFIGDTLAAYLNRAPGRAVHRAIPTTDFVAAPEAYLRPGVRPLVVSFGRSGNSSETLGMLDLLDQHAPDFDQLRITCNADSALGRVDAGRPDTRCTLVLPAHTNDRGFAMTSSYTTMLLTALACFDPAPPAAPSTLFRDLAAAADAFLATAFERLAVLEAPARAVFLGSGPLTGSARESSLKVLELSGGRIPTSWDSTLGFRHGPKAVTEANTLVFVYESADPHTRRYDADLAAEVATQFGRDRVVRVAGDAAADIRLPTVGNDAWSSPLRVMVAQVLAVLWSNELGLDVDDPFAGRNLTRVVAGVTLYPLSRGDAPPVGALDVGGTKIEAALFDHRLQPLTKKRVETPRDGYGAFLDAVVDQIGWLEREAGGPIAVGVGLPGLIDSETGLCTTANLPASGHALGSDLSTRVGRPIPVANDCKAFALSEANDGAGAGFRTVFGLIVGTGIGGGVCVDGELLGGLNGLAGEVGHIGAPVESITRHGLPVVRCGCGRFGCFETYVAGPGVTRIAEHVTGRPLTAEAVMAGAAGGDAELGRVRAIWLELLAELMLVIHFAVDPDCVVIGGGLSQIEGLEHDLALAFAAHKLAGARSPAFRIARHGDASGARGAAILASRPAGAGGA